MNLADLLPTLQPVLSAFERWRIEYYIGGSVASSAYGEPRSTLDVDLGADVPESAVHDLAAQWNEEFYVSESAMKDAVKRGKSFNLIHLSTSLKVDIFVCGSDEFNASVLKRRLPRDVAAGDESTTVWLATPEDVVLHKFVWYRKGGETSDRQWRDIAGILKQQKGLDTDYLTGWSDRLNVRDLWERIQLQVSNDAHD